MVIVVLPYIRHEKQIGIRFNPDVNLISIVGLWSSPSILNVKPEPSLQLKILTLMGSISYTNGVF